MERSREAWLPNSPSGPIPNCGDPDVAPKDGISESLCRNAQDICCNPSGGGCCPSNAAKNCWWDIPRGQ
ncbi:hypothetical protein CF326_g1619 [Tilletia indica]|nr:hypothetical protein CF326_g1619 [Tilletia indica]